MGGQVVVRSMRLLKAAGCVLKITDGLLAQRCVMLPQNLELVVGAVVLGAC